ncbi:MAG: glycoside hydrolase family 3 protein [Oscillospiraceae bacterium]|nr:glycoside hydrolase family 3 protein [Oscillospiraceae bacterium]
MRRVAALLLTCLLLAGCGAQTEPVAEPQPEPPRTLHIIEPTAPEPAAEPEKTAAEKLLAEMSDADKVAQLFIIRPEQLDGAAKTEVTDALREAVKAYPVGGFALFAQNIVTPGQTAALNAELAAACAVAPILAVDEEGGLVARLANNPAFDVPRFESTLSLETPENAYAAADAIGGYLREYGFNMDFAPVADVNTNPDNPVIGSRAFGDEPAAVSQMVRAYLDGLHAHGIIGSIKHFPGHGDTKSDTHTGFVAVDKTWDELLDCELIPFRENFENCDTVMVAHITMRGVTDDGLPATLSPAIVRDKLRGELGYDGVVVTDSMEMGAITQTYGAAEAAVLAVEAGCDLILLPLDFHAAYDAVLDAVQSGRIREDRLNESVLRILTLKERYGMIGE